MPLTKAGKNLFRTALFWWVGWSWRNSRGLCLALRFSSWIETAFALRHPHPCAQIFEVPIYLAFVRSRFRFLCRRRGKTFAKTRVKFPVEVLYSDERFLVALFRVVGK